MSSVTRIFDVKFLAAVMVILGSLLLSWGSSAQAAIMSFQEGVSPDATYQTGAAWFRSSDTSGNFNAQFIVVGTKTTPDVLRSALSFDLAALPDLTQIDSVTLTVRADRDHADSTSGNYGLDLQELTRSFVESEVTWASYSMGNNWTTPGGDFNSTVLSHVDANPYSFVTDGPSYTFSSGAAFVQAAQDAYDNDESLDLILRSLGAEGLATYVQANFYVRSDEYATASNRPKLTVNYSIIPEPSTLVLLGIGSLVALAVGIRRRRR